MEDEACKDLSDLVRACMGCRPQGPESISSWGLYVGGVREAGNQELLQTLGITAVVNAAPDVVHIEYPKHWRVLVVDAEDDPCYPLLETHMEATMEFLEQQRKESRPVLLHCFAGMNRSVALAAAYLVVKERMALRSVVRLLASKRGWVLSNDGFMRQLVRLARDEGLLDCALSHLDSVIEEPDAHEVPLERPRTDSAQSNASIKLGRSLSRMSMSDAEDQRVTRTHSALSDVSDAPRKLARTERPEPRCTISDKDMGYASRLPRQDSISWDLKKMLPLTDLRSGTAPLRPGMYLYVIMLGDPERIRLIHEDDLVHEGVLAGHTSLVDRNEFRRGWARQWESNDPEIRHTVLYAGELEYEPEKGVIMWNNHSGHYTPSAEDHVRVQLDPATFVAYE